MEMDNLQPIEGITPGMLWTALIVLVAGAGLYVLYGKVRDTYRKQQEYKRMRDDPGAKLANEISAKVMERLEPRFAEIDRKLANDKTRIDEHSRAISMLSTRTDGLETGNRVLCRGVLALLNHELHNGNSDEMEKAKQGIDDYLIEK